MLQDKLAAKEEKQAKEKKYTFALVDGRQEQVHHRHSIIQPTSTFCLYAKRGFQLGQSHVTHMSAVPCFILCKLKAGHTSVA